jgi:hypothetical protein
MGFYSTEMISMAVTTVVNGAKNRAVASLRNPSEIPENDSPQPFLGRLRFQIIQIITCNPDSIGEYLGGRLSKNGNSIGATMQRPV